MSLRLRIKNGRDKRPFSYNVQANSKADTTRLSRARSMYADNKSRRSISRTRTESFGALEELAQCGICLERLNCPKMLPCQHTFCISCLRSQLTSDHLKVTSDKPLKCLTCKKETVIADGVKGLEQLPSNLYIDSLLQILNFEKDDSQSDNVFVEIKCARCFTICNLKEHNCNHCKLDFCMNCWPLHAEELRGKKKELLQQLSELEDQLTYKQEDSERQCLQLKECVKVGAEAKMQGVKEMERNILLEIEDLRVRNKQSLIEIQQSMKVLGAEMDEFCKPNDTDSDKVKNYMDQYSKMSNLVDKVSHFGEINKIFNADTYKLEEVDEPNVQDDDVLHDVLIGNALDSEQNLMIHYKTRPFVTKLIWSKCPKLAGIGLPPWSSNIVYIAATDSRVVLVFNRTKNKLIGRLSHPNMLYPYSLDFCKIRKETFVSDKWKHCVHVFSQDGEYLRFLCARGHEPGQVISPQGIALNDKGELLVCDTGNDRVLVLDTITGEQKATIGLKGRRTELNMPTDVAIFKDNIFIMDTGNHRVKIFGLNGEKIKEFGSLGQEKGQFRCAEVVTVDPLGFILVGDSGNARIQVFDPRGNLVRSFGCSSSKPGLKWISGIRVTPDLDIIACDHKNKSLIIF